MKKFIFCILLVPSVYALEAGFGKADITPYEFETYPKNQSKPGYKMGGKFWDTGVDRKFDYEEKGAFGKDGKPGVAGVDDDGNGVIDDCSRENDCPEYSFHTTDDIYDPHYDNHSFYNPKGTEGDGIFQFVHLAGFSPYYGLPFIRNRLATDILDQVWSRAVAVKGDNGEVLILVSTDLPGLNRKYINPVKRAIQKKYGIPFDNMVFTSTHNHSAPDGSGYWVTTLHHRNDEFSSFLQKQMYESVVEAIENMRPAVMKPISTTHFSCMDEKTKVLKKDPDCNYDSASLENGGVGTEDRPLVQRDKRDPAVRNTEIVAAQFIGIDGDTIGTIINWHSHPDTISSKDSLVSSDYPHYIRKYVEHYLGGTAVFMVGTLGTQIGSAHAPFWDKEMNRVNSGEYDIHGNPVPVINENQSSWDNVRSIGYEIGMEVVNALNSSEEIYADYDIIIDTRKLETKVNNFLHLVAAKNVWTHNVQRADRNIYRFRGCFSLLGCVQSEVSYVQMGPLSFLTGPGEIEPAYWLGRKESTYDYGKKYGKLTYPALPNVKDMLAGKYKMIFGSANNYLSYLFPVSDNIGALKFNHPNHYEEFVTTDKRAGDKMANLWMEMLGSDYRYKSKRSRRRRGRSKRRLKMVKNLKWWKLMDKSHKHHRENQ